MRKILYVLCICLLAQFHFEVQAQKISKVIKVASFNIQYDNQKDHVNTWSKRQPNVAKVFDKYQFDIVGAQEPYLSQITGLLDLIPDYTYIGINILGNTDVVRKHNNPIFYKKDKFDVLDWGTFWFSETPDVPGKGWDAHSNRICTWAKFKDKESSKEFFFFNIHFDHKGAKARKESSLLLLSKIKEIAKGYPLIVTGDFNTHQHHDNYKSLNESNLIKDSYHLAKRIRNRETPTYNKYDAEPKGSNRIDHIFLSINPAVKVKSYRIITDSYNGIYPSDHFPVMIEVEIPGNK